MNHQLLLRSFAKKCAEKILTGNSFCPQYTKLQFRVSYLNATFRLKEKKGFSSLNSIFCL